MTRRTYNVTTGKVTIDQGDAPSYPLPQRAIDSDLSPAEFEWLLAYTGLEDIWTGLEQNFKPSSKAQYAFLRGTRKKSVFSLGATKALVAQFRPAANSIDPSVDLSDAAITAAWELATQSGV